MCTTIGSAGGNTRDVTRGKIPQAGDILLLPFVQLVAACECEVDRCPAGQLNEASIVIDVVVGDVAASARPTVDFPAPMSPISQM